MRALADVLLGWGWTLSGWIWRSGRWRQFPGGRRRLSGNISCLAGCPRQPPPVPFPPDPLLTPAFGCSQAMPPNTCRRRPNWSSTATPCRRRPRASPRGRTRHSDAELLPNAGAARRGPPHRGHRRHARQIDRHGHACPSADSGRPRPTVVCGATPVGAGSGGRRWPRAGARGTEEVVAQAFSMSQDPSRQPPPSPSSGGPLFVVEACEYRANFLQLRPWQAAITGIEPDHFDCYDSLAEIEDAFRRFAESIPGDGLLVARHDCQSTRRVTAGLSCRVESFGLVHASHYVGESADRVLLRRSSAGRNSQSRHCLCQAVARGGEKSGFSADADWSARILEEIGRFHFRFAGLAAGCAKFGCPRRANTTC